jgi:hypothetical protein
MHMKVTDRLKVEHGIFLRQLRYLEHLLSSHSPKTALATAVETICRAEEQHAALEDRVLYPALTKLLGEDHPALQRLNEDHGATLSNWNAEHIREAMESGEKGTTP